MTENTSTAYTFSTVKWPQLGNNEMFYFYNEMKLNKVIINFYFNKINKGTSMHSVPLNISKFN